MGLIVSVLRRSFAMVFRFDLPDLPRGAPVDLADLVEGARLAVGQAGAQPDDADFPLGEGLQRSRQLVLQGGRALARTALDDPGVDIELVEDRGGIGGHRCWRQAQAVPVGRLAAVRERIDRSFQVATR